MLSFCDLFNQGRDICTLKNSISGPIKNAVITVPIPAILEILEKFPWDMA